MSFSAAYIWGFLFLTSFFWSALAEKVVYYPEKDTSIFEPYSTHSGGGGDLYIGRSDAQESKRILMKFDLSRIPSEAIVTSAKLELFLNRAPQSNQVYTTFEFYNLLRDWGEGKAAAVSGAGPEGERGDATWMYSFMPSSNWTNQGGDFNPKVKFSGAISSGYDYKTFKVPVKALQEWITDPNSNYGWLIMGDETQSKTARKISSRESEHPPILTIKYKMPTTTTTKSPKSTPNNSKVSYYPAFHEVLNASSPFQMQRAYVAAFKQVDSITRLSHFYYSSTRYSAQKALSKCKDKCSKNVQCSALYFKTNENLESSSSENVPRHYCSLFDAPSRGTPVKTSSAFKSLSLIKSGSFCEFGKLTDTSESCMCSSNCLVCSILGQSAEQQNHVCRYCKKGFFLADGTCNMF